MSKGYIFSTDNGTITNGISKLATVTGISLTAAATTNLYTVPAGASVVITEIVLRITAVNTFISGATISVGKTASYNEWLVATAMGNLSTVGQFRMLSHSAAGLLYQTFAAAEIVALNVTIGATSTTLTATADIYGYLF